MIPTEDGMKLITVLPDVVKSTKLTADWENALTLVAKGEMEREDFMADIETMVSDLIHTYHEVSDERYGRIPLHKGRRRKVRCAV